MQGYLIRFDLDDVLLFPNVVPVVLFVKFVLIPVLLKENIPLEEVFENLSAAMTASPLINASKSSAQTSSETRTVSSWCHGGRHHDAHQHMFWLVPSATCIYYFLGFVNHLGCWHATV